MSMRHWDPSLNGHDHFFATFGKFRLTSSSRTGDMLAEVAARAAAEHVSYLELMVTTEGGIGATRGIAAGWDPDLPKLRDKLLAAGFRDAVSSAARTRLDEAEARKRALLACGTAAGQPRLPHHDPLHLPGQPRQQPAGGVRPDAGRIRNRHGGSARRQPQPGAAGRRSDRGPRFLAADVDARLSAHAVSRGEDSRCTPAS